MSVNYKCHSSESSIRNARNLYMGQHPEFIYTAKVPLRYSYTKQVLVALLLPWGNFAINHFGYLLFPDFVKAHRILTFLIVSIAYCCSRALLNDEKKSLYWIQIASAVMIAFIAEIALGRAGILYGIYLSFVPVVSLWCLLI